MPAPHPLTPADRATLGTIVTRFPGLASAVHAQVTRLLAAVLPAGAGALANLRGDPPTELDELVDAMVPPLARNSVAQARPGLVERVLGAKWN